MEGLDEIKVTTGILLKGALIFAIIDPVFIAVLARLIRPEDLLRLKWKLVGFMGLFFFLLFGSLVSIIFWDSVYCYVFPLWARWIIPPVYGLLFAAVGLFFWWLAFRLCANAVICFCLLGGAWGLATHLWAIYRGIMVKPPMLQGASPAAAVLIATFEFIFYWCICLGIVSLSEHLKGLLPSTQIKSGGK
jgi:hypothetical protein